jgi:hypothetical protein
MVRILSSHACHGSALRSGYFSAGNWIVPVEKLRKPGNAGRMELSSLKHCGPKYLNRMSTAILN